MTGLCAAFALLPDLDTASIPQRWFYRGVVLALVVLIAAGFFREAALIGVVAMLPLVHHHRGWTHRWWAALLLPLGVLLLWGLLPGLGFDGSRPEVHPARPLASIRAVIEWVGRYLPFYLAMAGGHGLHLVLDRVSPAPRQLGRRGSPSGLPRLS